MEEKLRHKVITARQWHSWTESPVSPTPALKLAQATLLFNTNNSFNILLLLLCSVRAMISFLTFHFSNSPQKTVSKVPGNSVKSASRFIPFMIFTASYKIQGQPVNHQMRALCMPLHSSHSTQITTWLTRRNKMEKNSKTWKKNYVSIKHRLIAW